MKNDDQSCFPLYISRPVLNGSDLNAWSVAIGLADVVPPEKLHVTIAYCRDAVDPTRLPPADGPITLAPGTGRLFRHGPESAVVLMLDAAELMSRHHALRFAGVPWQRDRGTDYHPHVSLAYTLQPGPDGVIDGVIYPGLIALGPEQVERLRTGWRRTLSD